MQRTAARHHRIRVDHRFPVRGPPRIEFRTFAGNQLLQISSIDGNAMDLPRSAGCRSAEDDALVIRRPAWKVSSQIARCKLDSLFTVRSAPEEGTLRVGDVRHPRAVL